MTTTVSTDHLLARIAELEARLDRSEQENGRPLGMTRRDVFRTVGAGAIAGVATGLFAHAKEAHAASGTVAGAVTLAAPTSIGDTTLTLSPMPVTTSGSYSWIIIDPFTTQCEIRKVTAIGANISLGRALAYAHSSGDTVLWADEPIFNVAFYGASAANSGGANVTAIQAAINDAKGVIAGAGGGLVLLPELYTINDAIILSSNITLAGLGRLTGLKMENPLTGRDRMVKNDGYGAPGSGSIDKNIAILNMTFDATHQTALHGVILLNVDGILVDKCWFIGPGNPANDKGHGALCCGGISSNSNALGYACYNVRVTNCYFYKQSNFSVQFGNVINGVISNNVAEDCYREVYGVEPVNSTYDGLPNGTIIFNGSAENITISGNVVRSGSTGFNQGSPTGVIVVTGYGAAKEEFRIRNVTVVGNTVETIDSVDAQGVHAYQVPPYDDQGSKNKNPGITILGATNITVVGNTVKGMAGAGITVGNYQSSTFPSVKGTIISGNTILDCNQNDNPSGSGTGAGVSLRNAQQILVVGNSISGAKHTYAVEETAPMSLNNLVANNIVMPIGTQSSFSLLSTSKTSLLGNKEATAEPGSRIAIKTDISSHRPINPMNGEMYWDTTIGKPIWWNGSNWKDATGTTV